VTPHPPPRRYGDRDVIARAAARLATEEHPVLVEVSAWLADVARDWDEDFSIELDWALRIATAALRQPAGAPDAELLAVADAAGVVKDGAG
jgi:hypothetical protein